MTLQEAESFARNNNTVVSYFKKPWGWLASFEDPDEFPLNINLQEANTLGEAFEKARAAYHVRKALGIHLLRDTVITAERA